MKNIKILCVLFLFGGSSFLRGQISVDSSGKVAVGYAGPITNQMMVYSDLVDPSIFAQFGVYQLYETSVSDLDYIKGIDIGKNEYNIPSGITSSGYQIGLASQVFVSDSNFEGVINNQIAIWARTGIFTAGSSGERRINHAYGIYLEGISSEGTVTNHYGVYQIGAGTKNYFAGNVGIGTSAPSHKLQVTGTVRATSFISDTTTYADFVFDADYRLPPLNEVKAHIKEKGHLPGIPSEAEVMEQGIDLAAMQVALLQKIEELTLHQIAQAERLDAQAERIGRLETENKVLRAATHF